MVGWHHGLNAREFEMVKDREARGAAVHGVAKSQSRLSGCTTARVCVTEPTERLHNSTRVCN